MKNYLRPAYLVLAGLLMTLLLAACGDSVITSGPAAVITTAASTTAAAQTGPSLEISTDQTSIKVGQEVTVTGKLFRMGIPLFTLYLDDKAFVTDKPNAKAETHPLVQLVSAKNDGTNGVFVLRGLAAGKVKIGMGANGEIAIQSGGNTAYNFSSVASKNVEVTITGS